MNTHKLVPKHELLGPEESQEVLETYGVTREQIPKIRLNDPAIKELDPQVGDLIKITRKDDLVGTSMYYRVVVE